MKITIERGKPEHKKDVVYQYEPHFNKERPMALDVLLQAQEREHPDLAYRYGCRNGLCGICTVDINGKPRLACRSKVKSGDQISALKTLPLLKDLVVKRDEVNRQLIGRLPMVKPVAAKQQQDHRPLQSLNRCIECYACLHRCPAHEKNPIQGPFKYGNPYSFLKIQRVLIDPSASANDKQRAINLARELGIEDYDAEKVPGCGLGINLKKEVILPLQQASVDLNS